MLAAKGLAALPAAGAKRPNIVLFMVDDMGWQDTSLPFLYQDGRLSRHARRTAGTLTPNMEALARDGALFTNAYACEDLLAVASVRF